MENIIINKKQMNYKDYLTIITCITSFILGWTLVIIGFFLSPMGEVSDSVLWVLGQALLYCAAAIGINEFYSSKLKSFKREIREELRSKN